MIRDKRMYINITSTSTEILSYLKIQYIFDIIIDMITDYFS